MKKCIIFSMISSLCFVAAFANEEVLSITDNNDNNEVYSLVVNVDDNTQALNGLFKDTYINGNKIKRDILNPLDLKAASGMILEKRQAFNVLNLKSNNFDYDQGGTIIIDTLYNGITGERKTIELELAKDKDKDKDNDKEIWKLFKNQVPVSKFHVKVNKVILAGTVGIKTIIME